MNKVNLAIIGAGYWGKNLVRNFYSSQNASLKVVSDLRDDVLERIKRDYPGVRVEKDVYKVFNDSDIDGVVIATQAPLHYTLAKEALKSGKNVFVEKPLSLNLKDALELVDISEKRGLKLMVGHLMEYHPAVNLLKELIEKGELGEMYYIYTQRVNLGIIRKDENSLWSLAPHDFSIITSLFNDVPLSVSARGECYIQPDVEDVVFATLRFRNKRMAEVHVSWLDPMKIRRVTVVGSRKMVTFDDMEPSEKIWIYDKGARLNLDYESFGELISLRQGDIHIPKVEMVEPLKLECQHFIDCILNDFEPRTNGRSGAVVTAILEACDRSLKNNGVNVSIDLPDKFNPYR